MFVRGFICLGFLSLFSFSCASGARAMEREGAQEPGFTSFLKAKGPLSLTLEETIPETCRDRDRLITLLKATPLTPVPMAAVTEGAPKNEVGFSFPTTAPWCLLAAKCIRFLGGNPSVGDWGCGSGFFARHAVLSGGRVNAIDGSQKALEEANKLIWGGRSFLPEGREMKGAYSVFTPASVTNPGAKFMERQNQMNVAFNLIHYLNPIDADLFLKNFYDNTADGGIVFLVSDTPVSDSSKGVSGYNERKASGEKYPGYSVYTRSTVVFGHQPDSKKLFNRSVFPLLDYKVASEQFQIGKSYKGFYPLTEENDYDNGQTIKVNLDFPDGDILGDIQEPYFYATGHQVFNKFDCEPLARVLRMTGFEVLNSWYTDHTLGTLYPANDPDTTNKTQRSKAVVVARKPVHSSQDSSQGAAVSVATP